MRHTPLEGINMHKFCRCSRFAFAHWVEGAGTAVEVAAHLLAIFRRTGMTPVSLQCDNGAQFTSEVLRCVFFFGGM